MFELTREQFLERNRISEAVWIKSGCDWAVLEAIAIDHLASEESLITTAELFARMIQRIDAVHSVRFRVKNVEHLLEKIIRKCAAEDVQEKYRTISVENYYKVVTDLVGIRALHLFKADCFSIDAGIRDEWQLCEDPVAYVRGGDSDEFREELRKHGFVVQEHKAGYRSVHYVASTRPGKRDVLVELQVRTIFEEGWSEIDHTIRYPNFSNDPLLEYFLTIFNRMAGAADEMGSFVQVLSAYAVKAAEQQRASEQERDDAIAKMEEALEEAKRTAERSAEQDAMLSKLTSEVKRLRRAASAHDAQELSLDASTNRLAEIVLGAKQLQREYPFLQKLQDSEVGMIARQLEGSNILRAAKLAGEATNPGWNALHRALKKREDGEV